MTDLSDLYNECFEENEKLKSELAALRSPAPAATVTGWRLLEVGEIMQEGDEMFLDDWYPCLLVGEKLDGAVVRRRLTPPALTDAMRALSDKWEALANEAEKHSQSWEMISAYLYCAKELRSAVAAVREGSE